MEELYEELPGDQVDDYPEDLYEDLPASEVNYPDATSPYTPNAPSGGFSPPPLPSGPIPTHRPGGPPPPPQSAPPPPTQAAPPPPLPTRSATTTLSSSPAQSAGSTKTLQHQTKKGKPDTKKKGATIARSGGGSSGGGGGGGGGGIDMKEVLKKARLRSEKAIEDLEQKRHQRDETDDDKHAAPWLNQLRKTAPPPPKPKPIKEPEMNGTAENNVPEFIKKARTFSVGHESEQDAVRPNKPVSPVTARKPPTTAKPPVTTKPRLPIPSMPAQDNAQPEVQEKPAWMKQRERQFNMAKMSAVDSAGKPAPGQKPPVGLPNGNPGHGVSSAPPPAKKPRPVPTPRNVTSPKREALPAVNESNERESPPLSAGGSVKDRAKSLERGMTGGNLSPPPSPKIAPKPVPPTRTTPVHQVGGNHPTPVPTIPSKPPITTVVAAASKPAPYPPVRREFKEPAPPPPVTPPPPSPSPMPPPPIPSKAGPFPSPGPPSMAPPSSFPVTQGESTPPMVSLQKFRRLPLQSVDIFNPPSVPSRNSKSSSPIEEAIDEDIYDDTVGAIGDDHQFNGFDDGEELYDDLADTSKPPPPMAPPPSTRPPPPPMSAPPDAPPPLPSGPPPSRYPTSPATESESNVDEIPTMDLDEEQETYEDVSVTAGEGGQFLSSSPTSNSLVPPSPQHSIGSSTGVPPASPTLQRNKKLSKEEKRLQEEERKKEKERKRLEKEKEKEKKKKDEIRMKNRAKGIKLFKQFPLRMDVQHLFTVEALLDHPKTKDHLPVTIGEVLFVLLLAHDKLPDGKYLAEKEDGTIGYVGKNITQRTAYQSAQNALSVDQLPPAGGPVPDIEEDIYESLPQDELQGGDLPMPMGMGVPPPNLPPPNSSGRFPPPAHAPPPPPADGPEELYEELPEDGQGSY